MVILDDAMHLSNFFTENRFHHKLLVPRVQEPGSTATRGVAIVGTELGEGVAVCVLINVKSFPEVSEHKGAVLFDLEVAGHVVSGANKEQ